jgi:hypothetical protein
MTFDGVTYDEQLDGVRLHTQMNKIFEIMSDEGWHTLRGLSEATATPEASVSAHIRSFRKQRFGGYIVDRRRTNNYFEYRLNLKPEDKG